MKIAPKALVILIVIGAIFIPSQSSSQSNKKEYDHLLWRISGNGLQGTSYLFGTMHVMDKRAFNFADSLYAAIVKSDGYAMELHPDSMMTQALNKEVESDSKLVKDIVSSKAFNAARKQLEEKLKQPANKITVKQLRDYYRKWTGLLDPDTGMETIIDAYFYNAAKRAGKWVGGIEDVADQLSIFEEINYEEFLVDLINNTTKSRKYIDDLMRIYTTESLSEFDSLEKTYTTSHPSMIRRNKKMAIRIDSLAGIRNTFFAVGAAHIPGDSGVVSLLRKRGFKVEPVISSKKIHATAYKFPEKLLPWKTIKSDSGYYTTEFPADLQKNETSAEREVKMYIDLGTLTIYMTIFAIKEKIEDDKTMIYDLLKNLTDKDSLLDKKPIELNGIKGTEILIRSEELLFRMRLFYFNQGLYAATVGGQTKKAINSADAERFLNAFTINKDKIAIAKKGSEVNSEYHGFSIKFPGKPTTERGDTKMESYIIDRYKYSDEEQDAFFQVSIKNVVQGRYMTGDSAMLSGYVKSYRDDPDYQLTRHRYFRLSGYAAAELDLKHGKGKDAYRLKVLYVHRGNRVYIVTATTRAVSSTKIADDFISSFSLRKIEQGSRWSLRTDPTGTFKSWVPDSIDMITDSATLATTTGGDPYFEAYDSIAPATLYVNKAAFPALYWANSDTSLLRDEAYYRIGETDSLLEYKLTKNGRSIGAEILVKLADNSNLKKMRLVLNGDTLYMAYTFAPPECIETINYQKFFDDFRLTNEKPVSTILTRKTAEFLAAVRHADTASIKPLKTLFRGLKFDKEDLKLLHEAAMINYADSATEDPIAQSIVDVIASVKDKRNLDFVNKTYRNLPAEKEYLRYDLLRILAAQGLKESHDLIAELVNLIPPAGTEAYRLFSELRDTLTLSASIFPKLLPMLRNESGWRQLTILSNDLLDKKMIKSTVFDSYWKDIDSIAEIAYLDLKEINNEYTGYYYPLMNFFAKINSTKTLAWLKKFSTSEDLKTRYYIAFALLDNKLAVPAAEMQTLVAKNEYRNFLYEKMKEIKKESSFPQQYRTQKAITESELYVNVFDHYELTVKKIEYVGERIRPFGGKDQKFLLYKVTIQTGDDTEVRLGIAGAYSLTLQPIVTSSSVIGLYVEEPFDPTSIDAQLKAFLEEKANTMK